MREGAREHGTYYVKEGVGEHDILLWAQILTTEVFKKINCLIQAIVCKIKRCFFLLYILKPNLNCLSF